MGASNASLVTYKIVSKNVLSLIITWRIIKDLYSLSSYGFCEFA